MVLETGEAREVHHHCLLVGYGADAINPYMAFEAHLAGPARRRRSTPRMDRRQRSWSELSSRPPPRPCARSWARWASPPCRATKGAQIFEAVGLDDARGGPLLHRHGHAASEGVGFEVARPEEAIPPPRARLPGPRLRRASPVLPNQRPEYQLALRRREPRLAPAQAIAEPPGRPPAAGEQDRLRAVSPS
jgi:hypothetical protein